MDRKYIIIIIVFVILALALGGWFWYSNRPTVSSPEETEVPDADEYSVQGQVENVTRSESGEEGKLVISIPVLDENGQEVDEEFKTAKFNNQTPVQKLNTKVIPFETSSANLADLDDAVEVVVYSSEKIPLLDEFEVSRIDIIQ